ncbi:unnamed protein product, partial [Strongylus vulgaris]
MIVVHFLITENKATCEWEATGSLSTTSLRVFSTPRPVRKRPEECVRSFWGSSEVSASTPECDRQRKSSVRALTRNFPQYSQMYDFSGFGYIEFNNAAAMNEAIAGMNMFDLGGQFLRSLLNIFFHVGRCITPPEALTYLSPQTQGALPTAAAQAAAAVTAKVMAAEASGAVKHQGSGSNSPRAMSPAPATPPLLPPPGIACPSPPTITVPTLSQPKLTVPPPPVAVATPHLYNPPPIAQVPPVSYPPVDYGVPPPPLNGYPSIAPPISVPPVPPPPATQRGFGGFAAPVAPPPVAPPSAQYASMPPPPPPAARPQPTAPKGERSFEEKMERILERTKAKQEAKLAMPVTFGAIDP